MKKIFDSCLATRQNKRAFVCAIITVFLLQFTALTTKHVNAGETALRVVTSIKPIHSLVANVMQGIGTPKLIIDGASSPHGYTLKPSQATELQQADIVFWVGHSLEAFLEKPLKTIASKAIIVELEDLHGIIPIKEDHDDHKSDAHKDEHEHGNNSHLWLSPKNAKVIVSGISKTLSKADPKNAAIYSQNAQKTISELDALINEVTTLTSPVKDKRFIVFHDAYKPFEQEFGLRSAGVISINPEAPASVARIKELQEKVSKANVTCIFTEPQFNPKLAQLVAEGSNAKLGTLDPLGATLKSGPDLYFKLMQQMATAFSNCLE